MWFATAFTSANLYGFNWMYIRYSDWSTSRGGAQVTVALLLPRPKVDPTGALIMLAVYYGAMFGGLYDLDFAEHTW